MTINVMVNGDTTVESDETFTVKLTSPINATLSGSPGVGTIQNDDLAPPVGPHWQNPVNPLDVNADGVLSPQDVLFLANFLYSHGQRPVPGGPGSDPFPSEPPPYYDVSGSDFVTVQDALLVAVALRNGSASQVEGQRCLAETVDSAPLFTQTAVLPATVAAIQYLGDLALPTVAALGSTIRANPPCQPAVVPSDPVGANLGQTISSSAPSDQSDSVNGIESLVDSALGATPPGSSDPLDDFFAELGDMEKLDAAWGLETLSEKALRAENPPARGRRHGIGVAAGRH